MNIVTNEQSKMIDKLLEGHTVTAIAKSLRLHPSTLYRWLDKPEVKVELEERRKVLRKSARDKITGNVNNLVDKMLDLANTCTDQRVKYNAIKYLLDQCLGTPAATKEESNVDGNSNENKDTNTLKKEIEDIKNLKVVK